MSKRRKTEDLTLIYPHLATEWHPMKNGALTLNAVSRGSKQKAWWRCRANPAHEWEARISHRTNGIGCPYCSGRYATPESSLLALYPKLAEELHPTLNGDLTADHIKPKGDQMVFWQCRKETTHVWSAVVKSRVKGNGCPMCSNRIATSTTSLLARYPELAAEWHPTDNGTLTPDMVVPGSEKRVVWCCRTNPSHVWSALVRNRAVLGSGCPYCAGQRATPETSLLVMRPELAAEWHPTANTPLTPEQVLPNSSKSVVWRCRNNPLHEWKTTINSRASGASCPYCAGQKATPDTSLLVKYPNLAAEWHLTKNGDLTPDQVFPGSGLIVWWQCQKDSAHEWQARIQHRANGIGCPFCSGQRATPTTSLQAVASLLAAEWHPTRNGDLTPSQVKPRSNMIVWWQCHRDPSHEWQAVIDNRFSHGSGCPHYRPVIGSSVEDLFARILDEQGIIYERQKVIGRCRVDFYLPASNAVIEIQGCYCGN